MDIYRCTRFLSTTTNREFRNKLVRGAVGVGALKALSLALLFTTSILLARVLGPEGYGHYTFVVAIVTIISAPINHGLRQLVTREVASFHHGRDWQLLRGFLRRSYQWVYVGAILIVALVGPFSALSAKWEVADRWTLMFVGLMLLPYLGFNALRNGVLRGLGNAVTSQLPDLLAQPGFLLLFAAGLGLLGVLNPATALLSQVAAAAVALMIGGYLLRQAQPSELELAKPQYLSMAWISALFPFTLLGAVTILNNKIGILLLGWLGTPSQVAALHVADRGAQLIALSLLIVNMVIAPHITHTYREENWKRLQRLSRQSARAALAIAVPIALPLIFLGAPIVKFVFGTAYVPVTVAPLGILAVGQIINVAFGSVGVLLTMSGYERSSLLGLFLACVINVGTAIVLIPCWGAVGAAYAATLGMITWNVFLAIKVRKYLHIWPSAW